MTSSSDFAAAFARCPLIAILRGIRPEEVVAVGDALVDAGFAIIEVPLNSPDALVSIRLLADHLGARAMVGAGTVLNVDQVGRVRDVGGQLIVAPNSDVAVIAAACRAGLVAAPGYFTPTEAFAALDAGATALKLFPAEAASPAVVKAHRAVLPPSVPLVVVGGVRPGDMASWSAAGADGFGLGSALYNLGATTEDVATNALAFVQASRGLNV